MEVGIFRNWRYWQFVPRILSGLSVLIGSGISLVQINLLAYCLASVVKIRGFNVAFKRKYSSPGGMVSNHGPWARRKGGESGAKGAHKRT